MLKAFLNLTTRNKLLLSYGIIILLLSGITLSAYRNMAAIQASQEVLYHRDFADAVDLMALRSNINGIRAAILNLMLHSEQPERENWKDDIQSRSEQIDKLIHQLTTRKREHLLILNQLKELKSLYEVYSDIRDTQQIPLIVSGNVEEAKILALGSQLIYYNKIKTLADQLGKAAKQHAKNEMDNAQQKTEHTLRTFGFTGMMIILFSIATALLLSRVIAVPLKNFSNAASRIAAGDLTTVIHNNERKDEIGILGQTLFGMIENLRKLTLEICEGMNILATSSTEILATTSQVASGSAETATAVNETTATVEQVKQTVLLSNQKAKRVSDNAQQVVEISQTGQQAVKELVAGMNRIREHTVATAESIAKLNDQAQAIGEIIITVNDLAEQSNLLAVNAAIEATKVGEQGKGFTVVAQEIKSLAQQSKQATTQVRKILNDIQKATGTAVMATDLSEKAVEAGMQQSDAAAEAIRVLTESIVESAQAALQIAASSQQQLVGMEQVALAMENIKQACAQNVAGTKQAEVAAQNLHDLGVKLKQLVDWYKV